MTTLALAFLAAATVANLVFVVTYASTSTWWRNPLGRVILGEGAVVLLVLTRTWVSILAQQRHLNSSPTSVALLGLVAVVLAWYSVTYCWVAWRLRGERRTGNHAEGK